MPVHSTPRLALHLSSDAAQIAPARRSVERFAADAGLSTAAVADLGLCLNEALANVIRHAYGGAAGRPIEVTAEQTEDEVTVSVRDWGNGNEPSLSRQRSHDPLEPGGIGLICLKRLTDRLSFTPQPDGMLLVMAKRLTPPASTQRDKGSR